MKLMGGSMKSFPRRLVLGWALAIATLPTCVPFLLGFQQDDGLPPPQPTSLWDKRIHLMSKWRAAFAAQQAVEQAKGHTITRQAFEQLQR